MKAKKFRFGLTAKLTFLVAALLHTILGIIAYVSYQITERYTVSTLERQGDAISSTLNHTFEVLLDKGATAQMQRVAINTMFLPDVRQVTVVDRSGKVLACTDWRAIGKPVASKLVTEKLKVDDFLPVVEHQGDTVTFVRPLFSGHYVTGTDNSMVGAVEVVLERGGMQAMADNTLYELIRIQFGAYVLLSLLVALVLRLLVTRPLEKLYAAAEIARGGDRSARSNIRTNDEMGVVSEAFDNLSDTVEQSLKTLESKVTERTRSLEDALGDSLRANDALAVARQAAEDASVEARAASRAKSEFLAAMSHEIRTPLNGVIGMASLLLDSDLNEDQREYAGIIRTSGQALLGVLGDILDFSKIESGKIELEMREIDVRQCLEETLEVFAATAATKGVDLSYRMAPNCPVTCTSDPVRLRQILTNLVSNAVKFTSQGNVSIEARCSGEHLCFAVRDEGIGIPLDVQDRLFKPFSQVDASTTRRFGGTGLGLAISKRLVELLGGEITVESEAGRGATFHFSIAIGTSAVREKSDSWLEGKTAVIVDKSSAVRESLITMLELWGLQVQGYSDMAEALAAMKSQSVDLALVDVAQVTNSLPDSIASRRIPVVLHASVQRLREAKDIPSVAGILGKPIKRANLRETLTPLFSTPTTVSDPTPMQSTPTPQASSPTLGSELPARILLVEDNRINQRVAMRMLERLGYQADIAVDGAQAVERVTQSTYDIVFMDIQMPILDGLDATRQIRSSTSLPGEQPWIIAMTAEAMNDDEARCRAAGMNDYVTKPVTMETLANALRRGITAQMKR